MFIELNMIIIFFFRRPIIIGWGRDTGMILRPIRNSIRICGWRLDRQVDPIKIGFTGSPTLRPTTCRRPVLLQPLGAPNLRSLWPCSKGATTYQRHTHNSKKSKDWRTNNTEKSLNNKERPMKSFVKWSWTWHKVKHVRLILFGRLTPTLLLLLHLYINCFFWNTFIL